MAIANRTTAEVYDLSKLLGNTLLKLLSYRSRSRNPAEAAAVDTALASLKTALDATIADVTPNAG